jgi:hypothetical protein
MNHLDVLVARTVVDDRARDLDRLRPRRRPRLLARSARPPLGTGLPVRTALAPVR